MWVLCLHSNSVNTCHVSALINMVLSSACQRLPNKLTAEQAMGSNRGKQEANQLTFHRDGMTADSSSQYKTHTHRTQHNHTVTTHADMHTSVLCAHPPMRELAPTHEFLTI